MHPVSKYCVSLRVVERRTHLDTADYWLGLVYSHANSLWLDGSASQFSWWAAGGYPSLDSSTSCVHYSSSGFKDSECGGDDLQYYYGCKITGISTVDTGRAWVLSTTTTITTTTTTTT